MTATRRSPGISPARHWLVVCATLLAGLALGFWLGLRTGASPMVGLATQLPQLAEKGRTDPDAAPATDPGFDSWMLALALAARADSLESVIDELKNRELEPRDLVRGAVIEMSEDELASTIAMMTAFDEEELSEVRDIRTFATRLADIAMAGTLTEAEEPAAGVVDVIFAERAPSGAGEPEALDTFPPSSGRIYALFRTDAIRQSSVMLKWFRTDQPQILLFRRYSIDPHDPYGWIWLDKHGEWSEGRYQVDVFTGDEEMRHLAVGHFEVR